jgi:hypothetical protein
MNRSKDKNYTLISIDATKEFGKTQHLFKRKALKTKTSNTRNILNIIKAILDSPIASIILNGENMKSFPLKSRIRQGCPLSPSYST